MALRAPRVVMKRRILIGFLSAVMKGILIGSLSAPNFATWSSLLDPPSIISFDKMLFEFIAQNKQFKDNKTSFLRHV